jgi:hypothetical protein
MSVTDLLLGAVDKLANLGEKLTPSKDDKGNKTRKGK